MRSTTRRKFAFYVGLGLFSLSERLNAGILDDLAAATMQTVPKSESPTSNVEPPEHWTAAENRVWRWFERETLVGGQWQLTGITTPVNKQSGELYRGEEGYLSESLVPEHVRSSRNADSHDETHYEVDGPEEGQPSSERRERHGRPPSKWLRQLSSEELRIWLKGISVPETGVSGMTFFTHLTRDHSFDEDVVEGLTENEQAQLHSAAHYGY